MSFEVLTDTSGNLQEKQIRENDLKVIPFPYFYHGEEHTCLNTESFQAEAFYEEIRHGLQVQTSQIPPRKYAEFFEPILKRGKDIIFVSMSSGISGSCWSAQIGKDMILEKYPERRIEIIDSLGASLGEGLIAIRAAALREVGRTIGDAAQELRQMAKRMFNVFTVDDLMHLKRGGRLSNLAAMVGTVLNIKPILKGNEFGKIVGFAKIRGRRRSIEALAEQYEKLVIAPERQTVGIAQAACRKDAEYLAELLRRNRPPKEILTVDYEPVTGSHVGPGALALFFESREDVRLVSSL